ncbi:MAG: portal protein [Rhodospirillales bacterium]
MVTPSRTSAGAGDDDVAALGKRYRQAVDRRQPWETLWRDCYANALPQRDGALNDRSPGSARTATLYDGTAPDAVEHLAASLLSELTPPWSRWFALVPGRDAGPGDDLSTDDFSRSLDEATERLHGHFERSNFAVEVHQAYLDLVTAGTASLLFEEAPVGDAAAFRFTAVPLGDVAFEEGDDGRLAVTFRHSRLTPAQFRRRFPAAGGSGIDPGNGADPARRLSVVEAFTADGEGCRYRAFSPDDGDPSARATEPGATLAEGRFLRSPFINFRWLKAPGEIYGRSPVMKALPDIKTANKVVELVLKNASIAVTGIWQADDDGVLNPATVELTPGTIIPKAVGSSGLTPLDTPGRFDVSEIVLESLRGRIRNALMADDLGPADKPGMTATEVVERAAAAGRRLGATVGRLQAELLTPLVERAIMILVRRGEIAPEVLDRGLVELQWRAPLARAQSRGEARDVMLWLESLARLGPEALAEVDPAAAARWLASSFGVPPSLVRRPAEPAAVLADIAEAVLDTGATP